MPGTTLIPLQLYHFRCSTRWGWTLEPADSLTHQEGGCIRFDVLVRRHSQRQMNREGQWLCWPDVAALLGAINGLPAQLYRLTGSSRSETALGGLKSSSHILGWLEVRSMQSRDHSGPKPPTHAWLINSCMHVEELIKRPEESKAGADLKTAWNMTVLTVPKNQSAKKGALLAKSVRLQPLTTMLNTMLCRNRGNPFENQA